ncbi:MAG: QueT transporter family protein [Oscillospiraceae bacterium]|nr:QueT transporter family protein [Oscillospiraceae bacterium]
MKRMTLRELTLAAVLAAVYAALTVFLPIPQYGYIQVRVAEALTVLPFFFPAATPGLFIGCVIANLFSPFVLDVVFGSAATLLACLWTGRLRSRWLAPLPPVVCNALIVGAELAFFEVGAKPAFWGAFAFNAFTVGLGELLACCVFGSVLLSVLYSTPACPERIDPRRLEQVRGFE